MREIPIVLGPDCISRLKIKSNFLILTVCSNSGTNILLKNSEHLAIGGHSAFLEMLKLVCFTDGRFRQSDQIVFPRFKKLVGGEHFFIVYCFCAA